MARSNSSQNKVAPPATEKQAVASASAVVDPTYNGWRNVPYKSDGVEDHDVFLLPVSDYILALGVTVAAAVVRIFRIYQPASVVFDEVQCVHPLADLSYPVPIANNRS